jgi:ectoine hydroxylase-related dioxygenase (phytanoyl-CoA dioxygenase family)
MKQFFRDPARQEEFLRQGFTIVQLLSPDEVATLVDACARLRPDDDVLDRDGGTKHGNHTTFLDEDLDYKRGADAAVAAVLGPRIAELLVGYRPVISSFVIKAAHAAEVPLHIDWTFTERFDDIGINTWCPLVDVEASNGALRVLPGSHRLVSNIQGPLIPPFFGSYAGDLADRTVLVPLKAGEAVMFDTTILHASGLNHTDRPRMAAGSRWAPEDASQVLYRQDPTSRGKRFEIFSMEDGGFVEHGAAHYFGTMRRPGVGHVPNRNRDISLAEFEARLANGDAIRRALFNPRPTLAGRLRSLLGLSSSHP